MPIPSGVICGYTGSAASVADLGGWSRVTALDSRHTRGADAGADGGATGGAQTHTHDGTHSHGGIDAHTHAGFTSGIDPGVSPAQASGGAIGFAQTGHAHNVATSDSVGDAVDTMFGGGAIWGASGVVPPGTSPPYYGVIWIQSDGTPETLPVGSLVWWHGSTAPTSFTRHTLSGNRYLVGAPAGHNPGTTGGAATHVHFTGGHQHVTSGHNHTWSVGPASSVAHIGSAGGVSVQADTHTHTVFSSLRTVLSGYTYVDQSPTASNDPPFTILLPITPTTPDAPLGIICLWLGTIGTIPAGWSLCDGGGGRPDCRSRFVKASATGADIGTTGGAAGHAHSNSTTHAHGVPSHGHGPNEPGGTPGPNVSIRNNGGLGSQSPGEGHAQRFAPGDPPDPGPSVLTGFPAAVAPLLTNSDTRPPFVDVLYIQQTSILGVTITAPTPSQVETSPNPVVSWTIQGGHTQAKYLVNIYTSDLATRVYSSGIVTSAASSLSIPSGHVHNGHAYKVYVTLYDALGLGGTAGPVLFSESFTEPAGPTGVTATALPAGLPPNILVTWPDPTVPGGDTFVQWNVLRRVFGDVEWTTIATSTNLALRGFNDYTAAPGTEYEYAVTFTDTRGGDPVTSAPQDPPPSATLIFLGSWLHVVADPSIYLGYRSNGIKWNPTQDQVQRFAWGRRTPTYHMGAQRWKSGQLTEAPDFFPVYGGPVPSASQMVDAFLTAQASGNVLCYRFGQTRERLFVILDATQQSTSRTDDLVMSQQDITINETFYDESATSA